MRSTVGMVHRLMFLALLGVLTACGSDGSSAPTIIATAGGAATTTACRPAVDRGDVPYVEDGDPLQQLDLYVPANPGCIPLPLVVWVHGGGWQIGDKANAMAPKVRLWTDAGWAVASVNYRLSDAAVPEVDRVMAPSHNEDVAAAVGWLVEHAAETGIDPERIALLGHSAGAGIVASLATDPGYLGREGLEPADLGCVAPLDTEAFSIEVAVGTGPELNDVYTNAFGADPERWAELSPLTHVGEADLPDLFLVTRGLPARRQLVAAFAQAAEDAAGRVTIVDLPGFSHEDVNKKIGDPSDTDLTPALQAFLTTCLVG
jgi:arylformamidase